MDELSALLLNSDSDDEKTPSTAKVDKPELSRPYVHNVSAPPRPSQHYGINRDSGNRDVPRPTTTVAGQTLPMSTFAVQQQEQQHHTQIRNQSSNNNSYVARKQHQQLLRHQSMEASSLSMQQQYTKQSTSSVTPQQQQQQFKNQPVQTSSLPSQEQQQFRNQSMSSLSSKQQQIMKNQQQMVMNMNAPMSRNSGPFSGMPNAAVHQLQQQQTVHRQPQISPQVARPLIPQATPQQNQPLTPHEQENYLQSKQIMTLPDFQQKLLIECLRALLNNLGSQSVAETCNSNAQALFETLRSHIQKGNQIDMHTLTAQFSNSLKSEVSKETMDRALGLFHTQWPSLNQKVLESMRYPSTPSNSYTTPTGAARPVQNQAASSFTVGHRGSKVAAMQMQRNMQKSPTPAQSSASSATPLIQNPPINRVQAEKKLHILPGFQQQSKASYAYSQALVPPNRNVGVGNFQTLVRPRLSSSAPLQWYDSNVVGHNNVWQALVKSNVSIASEDKSETSFAKEGKLLQEWKGGAGAASSPVCKLISDASQQYLREMLEELVGISWQRQSGLVRELATDKITTEENAGNYILPRGVTMKIGAKYMTSIEAEATAHEVTCAGQELKWEMEIYTDLHKREETRKKLKRSRSAAAVKAHAALETWWDRNIREERDGTRDIKNVALLQLQRRVGDRYDLKPNIGQKRRKHGEAAAVAAAVAALIAAYDTANNPTSSQVPLESDNNVFKVLPQESRARPTDFGSKKDDNDVKNPEKALEEVRKELGAAPLKVITDRDLAEYLSSIQPHEFRMKVKGKLICKGMMLLPPKELSVPAAAVTVANDKPTPKRLKIRKNAI